MTIKGIQQKFLKRSKFPGVALGIAICRQNSVWNQEKKHNVKINPKAIVVNAETNGTPHKNKIVPPLGKGATNAETTITLLEYAKNRRKTGRSN